MIRTRREGNSVHASISGSMQDVGNDLYAVLSAIRNLLENQEGERKRRIMSNVVMKAVVESKFLDFMFEEFGIFDNDEDEEDDVAETPADVATDLIMKALGNVRKEEK
ncbi:MAG: hypothetical protein IJ110_01510 [Lachnospiraceae bacterium]|nr:hypothetical protein [Lachnospiraceae bacterium]